MRSATRRGLAVVVLSAIVAAGCGGGGPSVDKLEARHDVPGLIELAGSGDRFGSGPRNAVAALRRLHDPTAYTLLATTLRTGRYPSGASAVDSDVIEVLGALGGAKAATTILGWARASYVETDRLWPEQQVTWALTAVGADAYEPLAAIVEAPLPDKAKKNTPVYSTDTALRRIAVNVFGGRAADELDPFNDAHHRTRPVSSGALGSDRAERALIGVLRAQPECDVTASLTYACTQWGEDAGLAMVLRRQSHPAPLLALLDDPATARVYYGLVRLGAPGTEAKLVAALQRNTEPSPLAEGMVDTYVNSGNTTLESAGRSWASAHGYTVHAGYCPPPIGPCKNNALWGTIDEPASS